MDDKERIQFIFGAVVLFLFFAFVLAGLWMTAWYISAKLILTGVLTLMGGTACYFGLPTFWKFLGEFTS